MSFAGGKVDSTLQSQQVLTNHLGPPGGNFAVLHNSPAAVLG
jgi:hypothetical protein